MPNYVKEYISIEEFLILQQWKVPYTGFIKGVGYTYPQYDAVEFPLDWSIPNWTFGNYISHPLAIQIIDISPEAVFQSMNYSEQDILDCIKKENGNKTITFTIGNESITVPSDNYQTRIKIDDFDCSVRIGIKDNITGNLILKRIPFSKIREELQKRYSKKHKDFGDRITKDLIIDTSISCIDASADWAYNIMLDRGKYMPYNSRTITGKRVRLKKTGDIVIRSKWWNFTTNAKYLNYLRISGKFIGITGNVISISNAIKNVEENPNTKTVTSLITKTAIIGLGFIPVYGWAIAIVAGVADGLYGDTFYDYVDDLVNE
ncbi:MULTISPECIES: hypothetical protein [Bacteroidaceae]|uniref:Uncharacterized protein n=1 Tax=Phocaeicola vulgatus TaxID=821 RepID=A0A412QDW5_PHOVU|nr:MULTISPECIES: hypothetical protein [Bacteroidaceae]RGT89147.1 hypothetical protein DWX04_17155 [Phocaeicola vulgatus]RGU01329.1 hypothetical protein DWX01_06055 [Bacteroides eggerthii]RJV49817.1 hypothetical protein DWX15_17260 [Bacteroides sp. AF18-33]HAU00964.1 hypothetical protein [Bacteroides sp.]